MIMKKTENIYRRRFFVLILMGVIIMNAFALLTGCSVFEADTAKTVKKMLNEKYGLNFVVTAMGDRINTGSATLYCHPEDNENIRFSVVYNYSSKEISDDYLPRKYAVELENEIADFSQSLDVPFAAYVVFDDAKYGDVTNASSIEDFVHQSGTSKIFIRLALNVDQAASEQKAKEILNSLVQLSINHESVPLLVPIFMYHEDDYNNCVGELRERTEANNLWFESFNSFEKITIKVQDKAIIQNEDLFIQTVKG